MGCTSSTAVSKTVPKYVPDDILPTVGFFDKYDLADVLGRGAYGTVHLAINVESHDRYAVKILDMNGGNKHSMVPATFQLRNDLHAEQQAWAHIGSHPNVVGLHEFFQDDNFAYLVLELCTSSLFKAFENEPELNELTYAPYFKDMANALAHIHSVGVVHRDVKQDNFMVGGPCGRTVKLCDFGLSEVVVDGQQLTGHPGTAPYMAPELLTSSGRHGTPVDVWALGVIVYNAFFGCWPYHPAKLQEDDMKNAILQGHPAPSFAPPMGLPRHPVSAVGIRFVRALLDRNQSRRPTAASCLDMEYFNTSRFDQVHANGKHRKIPSLQPQLYAAMKCGAFTTKPPQADASAQRRLQRLQSTAQLRRESRSAGRIGTGMTTTSTPVAAETQPMPHQPC